MILFAVLVAALTLGAGLAVTFLLRALPTVRLQLAGLALLAVLLPLAAVLLSGVVMFESGHDLTIMAVAAGSSTAALVGALLLGRSIVRPIEELEATSAALARGDLAARAKPEGARELAELARSLNETAANLEELFDARRQLVAWASHDLRTPLASLQAMLEAVEDGLAAPDRYLPAMREQVETLGRLIDDLFELARIDAGVLTLELRDAPLTPVVESVPSWSGGRGGESRQIRFEARVNRRRGGSLRPREGRASPVQPAHERAAAYPIGRCGRGRGRAWDG